MPEPTALDKIRALYAEVPAFACRPGCTDCCGPVPWARSEWAALQDKRLQKSIDCPYSLAGHCDIYDQRPMICRLFGASIDPALRCPYGCAPARPLSQAEADALMDRYLWLMKEP